MSQSSKAQVAILEILRHGFSVYGHRYIGQPYIFRAECEYLPRINAASLTALLRKGLVTYTVVDSGNCTETLSFSASLSSQ